jgi:hypothetical protein
MFYHHHLVTMVSHVWYCLSHEEDAGIKTSGFMPFTPWQAPHIKFQAPVADTLSGMFLKYR